jgi:hypothetical protein
MFADLLEASLPLQKNGISRKEIAYFFKTLTEKPYSMMGNEEIIRTLKEGNK